MRAHFLPTTCTFNKMYSDCYATCVQGLQTFKWIQQDISDFTDKLTPKAQWNLDISDFLSPARCGAEKLTIKIVRGGASLYLIICGLPPLDLVVRGNLIYVVSNLAEGVVPVTPLFSFFSLQIAPLPPLDWLSSYSLYK